MNSHDGFITEFKLNENEFFGVDVTQDEYLLCKSRMFDFQGGCYARALMGEGYLAVHLDLPDDHPAVVTARENIGPMYAEVMKIEDIVPISDLERPDGRPIRVWKRPISSQERAERARKTGYSKPKFDELDNHLYVKYTPQGVGRIRDEYS